MARTRIRKGETVDVSPKVWIPACLQMAAGIALILLGFTVEGKTLVVSAVGTAGVGYAANPGEVVSRKP
jgi:hypothetical protein